ncbi:MAG: ABC transporter permease [Bacteroidales bacterium]|nr:ABC transporter permease [Bacteroidales bacterium]
MRELIHEIGSTLRNNKLRTALTGFAVSWGIFLLICLLGAGNGLMNSFMGNMEDFISQNITVEGWRTSKPYAGYQEGREITLDEKDVTFTESAKWSAEVSEVTRQTASTSVTFSLDGNTVAGNISGVMPDYMEQNKIKLYAGRFLNPDDVKERRKVLVLSLSQAKELLSRDPKSLVGRWVGAGPVSYLVVGIYHTDESDMYRTCPIPYTTYKGIYDSSDKVESITFKVDGPRTKEGYEAFDKEYGAAIRRRHDIAPDDRRGIWIRNGYTENMQMNDAQRIIRTALWILGLLTLVSGIVGVSNIMLITVKERTHEFGIRKAIGASPFEILKLIIAESVAITAAFGYVGMFLGMIACQVMDKTVGQKAVDIGFQKIQMLVNPSVGLDVALEATLLLIVAGTLAGAIPAWKAARVKPIEALRAE